MEVEPPGQEVQSLGEGEVEVQGIVCGCIVSLSIVDVKTVLQVSDLELIAVHPDTLAVHEPCPTERNCAV